MPERVTVLVLGGRLTPNLVGILALQPAAVEFVVSEDKPMRYNEICSVLEQFVELDHTALPRRVSAYDFITNRNVCLEVARAHPDAEIIFDVTSAPKIMGFAAYEVARFLNQRVIIVNTANGDLIDLIPPTTAAMPIEITLEQYLACYGRRPVSTFSFDELSIECELAVEAAQFLATGGEPAVEAMDKLRSWSQGKGKRTIPFQRTGTLTPAARDVLYRLQDLGLIDNLRERDDGRVSYTILNDMDWNYLEGTWLEVFVWDQARQAEDDDGRPLFQAPNLGLSFEVPSDGARKEIDFGCVYHGQFIHASCKTGSNPFRTQYLDEIRAVSSLIGGRFASRLFITNAFPPAEDNRDYQRFLAQAKDREIVIVTGEELANVGQILEKQVLNPTYWRV